MYPSSRVFLSPSFVFSSLHSCFSCSLIVLPSLISFLHLFSLPPFQLDPSSTFARQVTVQRIPPSARPRLFPRTHLLLLISVLHPTARSSMISSSRRNWPHFVIASPSLARSDSSRRSRYPDSERGETWTRSNEWIIDRRVLRSVIRRLSEAA